MPWYFVSRVELSTPFLPSSPLPPPSLPQLADFYADLACKHVHPFIHSLVGEFIHPFIHSFILSFIQSFIFPQPRLTRCIFGKSPPINRSRHDLINPISAVTVIVNEHAIYSSQPRIFFPKTTHIIQPIESNRKKKNQIKSHPIQPNQSNHTQSHPIKSNQITAYPNKPIK